MDLLEGRSGLDCSKGQCCVTCMHARLLGSHLVQRLHVLFASVWGAGASICCRHCGFACMHARLLG